MKQQRYVKSSFLTVDICKKKKLILRTKTELLSTPLPLPLYTLRDAETSLKYFHPIELNHEIELAKNLTFTLASAGHILEAFLIKVRNGTTTLLFTGNFNWLKNFQNPPKEVFITHGEPKLTEVLRQKIQEEFRWKCKVPEYLKIANLS